MLGWPVAWGWVGLMFVVLLVGAWLWLWPVVCHSRACARLARALAGAEGEEGGASPDALRTDEVIQEGWEGFKTAWKESAVEQRGALRSPVRLEDTLEAPPSPRQFAGVLLSLGVLGTFVGITLGLRDIETGNPAVLLDSIETLLGGMTVAFMSSIAGLLFFLAWLVLARLMEGWMMSARAEADARTRIHFPWVPAEELATLIASDERTYAELLNETMEEQNGLLANLGEDIAEKLEGPLTRSLEKSLAPALGELTGKLEDFIRTQREEQSQSIQDLVKEFQGAMASNIQEYVTTLNESLDRSIDYLARFEKAAGKTLGELESLGVAQSELLQRTDAVSETFVSSLEGLTRIHGLLKEALEEHSVAATKMREFSASVRGEAEVLSEANREVREALAAHLDSVQSQVKVLGEHSGAMRTQMEEIVPRLERSVSEFSGMAADRLRQVFEEFDKQMADVTRHLGGTLQQVRENVEDLTPATEHLRIAVEGMNEWSERSLAEFAERTESASSPQGPGQ